MWIMRKIFDTFILLFIIAVLSAGCASHAEEDTMPLGDGTYAVGVTLEGGSGKASVASPCRITLSGGAMTARIEFSSPHYDYVLLDGEKYLPVNTEGNSVFELPLHSLDEPCAITADTTAMSTPHEIDYVLSFDSASMQDWSENAAIMDAKGDGTGDSNPAGQAASDGTPEESGEKAAESAAEAEKETGSAAANGESVSSADVGSIPLMYAREYSALVNADGSFDVTIGDDTYHIDHTCSKIYLAASSAMDLFLSAGAIDAVAMTGTKASDWGIPEIRQMVEDGTIRYAGKYSAPDYEFLLSSGCDLAIESTMIYHSPDVREKLESLGIPVLVERSSYETDPLGRMEWIKLYGILTGHYEEAASYFDAKIRELDALAEVEKTGKVAAFFYINSNGQPVVRKSGDYISKMIEMAGGTYFLSDTAGDDNVLSTMNMQMEAFVEAAREADVLIYNSSIDAELKSLDELLDKDALFAGFKAVREGNVWCTGKNMFQETSAIADMVLEMHEIFAGTAGNGENLSFLHRLE